MVLLTNRVVPLILVTLLVTLQELLLTLVLLQERQHVLRLVPVVALSTTQVILRTQQLMLEIS